MPIATLIVDDQEDIRFLLRAFLEHSGEGLIVAGEAANGADALALLESLDPEVVILDQMMPGMNGLELAEQILQRRPGQAIVLCSAYLSDRIVAAAHAIGIKSCIPKMELHTVAAHVRAAIA